MLAVSLIGLASIAATALVWRLNFEGQTRNNDRRQAQLRQLLIAGAADSPRLFTERRDTWPVPLPPDLADHASVTLRVLPSTRDFERRVRVEATLDRATMAQTLRYARGQQGWGLIEARLDQKEIEN